ncbi:MAG TPA: hypothetical protein VET88_10955 [Gammaproteobacteria bacterium]|nr:hypothetical protein [Gammaproteobacteria bacterium]
MSTAKTTSNPQRGDAGESVSRRVADEMHERIDQAAEKGEKIEESLHERSAKVSEKAQELNSGISRLARDNPWAVVGGSVVLGFLIGAFTCRR